MRLAIIILSLCVGPFVFGQVVEGDSIPAEDTTVVERIRKITPIDVYAEGMLLYSPTIGEYNFSAQAGAGIGYKRFSMGVYKTIFLGKITTVLVFPAEFQLLYSYGGAYLGIGFIDRFWLEANLRVHYGHGDMVWEHASSNEDFTRDTFHLIKPELIVALKALNFGRLYASIAYTRLMDLDMPAAHAEDFSGLTFGVGLKLGLFQP